MGRSSARAMWVRRWVVGGGAELAGNDRGGREGGFARENPSWGLYRLRALAGKAMRPRGGRPEAGETGRRCGGSGRSGGRRVKLPGGQGRV
jgi:hypothetical protein